MRFLIKGFLAAGSGTDTSPAAGKSRKRARDWEEESDEEDGEEDEEDASESESDDDDGADDSDDESGDEDDEDSDDGFVVPGDFEDPESEAEIDADWEKWHQNRERPNKKRKIRVSSGKPS
ncbi:hypothetical protein K402DRAFT_396813 [Aulographum hederae CBS 113979]|uniref:Uncharacterized protein n=1 Tax=Aulographum hederae CBS 113979 TaxID=1176131 RepID=A0A6G1GQY0_9PEZI|nr:hypothetical protein K402DRAFT_396813 [Aulographum hederae CBS 113979]